MSRAGDAFNTVALVVLVFKLTGSGLGVAGTVAAEVLPVLLLGPVTGLIVDRYPRRRLMIVADLARAALALVLATLGDSVAAAYAVAEAGNLLMMPERALDQGPWITMSQALVEVGQRAVEAADSRSLDAVFDMGAEMYYVCTNCHGAYAIGTLRPNDARAN